MTKEPFSLKEVREASSVDVADLEALTASDGVTLSYRRYSPAAPSAAVLFYHGGGAHSGASYQHLGRGLQNQYDAVVFMPDIRGHGASGGPRGDTPSPERVWTDISIFIKYIRSEYPKLTLFLGGHSSGAGLILNYVSRFDHESVDSFIFLSPQFGFRSKTARPSLAAPFATVNTLPFIINAMSNGLFCGHFHAVRFHYPAELLASDKGLISSYTVNMANAITPSAPRQQFAALDRPFGLWIGADDELIMPSKVLALANLAASVQDASDAGIIPNEKHLSLLVNSHETIGPWISHRVRMKDAAGE